MTNKKNLKTCPICKTIFSDNTTNNSKVFCSFVCKKKYEHLALKGICVSCRARVPATQEYHDVYGNYCQKCNKRINENVAIRAKNEKMARYEKSKSKS